MIFENSSPKGIFGPNMSDSPNWSLTANSRSLQAAALKVSPTILNSLSLVLLLNGRLDFNLEIMEFQLLFLFSFILGSVFHEDKVSSLNKFERVLTGIRL